MFERTSRYASLATRTTTTPEGRTVTYVTRRFLPLGADMDPVIEVKMEEGDRLDLLAGRTLGSPLHFWRICDATDAMNPFDLTEEPDVTVRVPVPSAGGNK